MKFALGLLSFTLCCSLNAQSMLLLRGRVPASIKVEFEEDKNTLIPKIKMNNKGATPKITINKEKDHHIISIVHP